MLLRFAPCLYDDIHIGNLFVLFANYMHAKNTNSKLILRIDYKHGISHEQEQKCTEALIRKCNMYNIRFDSVVYQSKRIEIYTQLLQALIKQGVAYKHLNLYYMKLNRDTETIKFKDIVFGLKIKRYKYIHDPIIYDEQRNTFFYNFTSVIDDITMNIGTIIRGIDHIDNTFLQIAMMHTLLCVHSHTVPSFAHIPMCLDKSGNKISKTEMSQLFSFNKLLQNMIMYYAVVYYLFFSGNKINNIHELEQTFNVSQMTQSNKKIDIYLLRSINNKIIKFINTDEVIRFLSLYAHNLSNDIIKTLKFYVCTDDIIVAHDLILSILNDQYSYKHLKTENTYTILQDVNLKEYEKINKIFNITYGKELLMFVKFEQIVSHLR